MIRAGAVDLPAIDDVRAAAERIRGNVYRTPVCACPALGFRVKAESLQKGGAFKIRGALNRVLSIPADIRARGVVAFSSGNHAQGVAIAARIAQIPAVIVMPDDSLPHKVAATRAHGAEVITRGVTVQTRTAVASRIAEERGMTLVPPFDDFHVIAGQGTVGLEIVEQFPEVDTVVVPLGGGGLLAGVALALRTLRPGVRVIGVEPEAGNDGQQSFRGQSRITLTAPPTTIADGARTLAVGERNLGLIRACVDDVVTVSDDALLDAMWLLAEHAKLVVEPTGALAAAAITSGVLPGGEGACVVASGGNVSAEMLARVVSRAAARSSRPAE